MNSILKLLAELWQWSNKVKKQISSHAIRMINCPLTSFCNAWPVNCPRMHILCNESLVFRWRNNRLGIIPASSGVLLCALCMDSGTVVCYITEMTQGLHRYHLTQARCCVVFPRLGADWQSVKTGTSLEWVNFADGEWMSLKILWMNFIHAPLYDQNIFYHSMWKWKLAGTSMAFKFCWVDKKIDEISYSLSFSLSHLI